MKTLDQAGDIRVVDSISDLSTDPRALEDARNNIKRGSTYVVKSGIETAKIREIVDYLSVVGRSSLPNYHRIEKGCPNFHRINAYDERANVGGCFHQFSFFPWNQDLFGFFKLFRNVFELKNQLSDLPPDSFLNAKGDNNFVARVSFQFYPKGGGQLNRHKDPVDRHQITLPGMIMSEKGTDFSHGGLYIESKTGERIMVDELAQPGDILFFNAQITHGVEVIDPETPLNWPAFEGRWMALFAVNKFAGVSEVPNSVELLNS